MKSPQVPIPNLSKKLGIQNEIWFKFENKHHYGSHKGRSIPYMIDEYKRQGVNSFVISSSGNAAIAAFRAVISHNKNKPGSLLSLKILVGQNIAPAKLTTLKDESAGHETVSIEQSSNPKQSAMKYEKETGATWLRSSTDPLAIIGYQSLADELKRIENLSAVFIPSSSGTAAEGLYQGFKNLGISPQIHIVQTNACHALASYVYELQGKEIPKEQGESIADAIVDKVGRRKATVAKAVMESGGAAWIADDEEIKRSQELACADGIEISTNSALSLAGLQLALASGYGWQGPVVCIISGD
jgi:threonine synthase